MQIVFIDLIPQKDKPVVNLSQFDNDRVVRFMLLENGLPFTLAGTEDVECDIKKPDGNIVVITPLIGADNYIDVYFTEQAAACYGRSFGELSIHYNSTIIGTCNFYLDVEISPTHGGIESDSAIQNLKRQVDAITMDYLINNTDEIAEVIANKIYPTLEASGDVATFNTILQLPLVSVTADPLATEITRCGINLWNEEWEVGSIDSATGINEDSSSNWRTTNYIKISPDTEYYTVSVTAVYKTLRARFYDENKNYIGYSPKSGTTFTDRSFVSPDNAYYIRFAPITSEIPNHDLSFNYPSSDTAYHAYNGITKPIADATTIATLTGINNVFTDNGPVTVQYKYFPDI